MAKRGSSRDVGSDSNDSDDEQAPKKRAREDATSRSMEFRDRHRDRNIVELHHPEKLAAAAIKQRQHVLVAHSSFVRDLKAGVLSGPRVNGPSLLKVRAVS